MHSEPKSPSHRYFVNAPVDVFLVAGASLLTYAAMLLAGIHEKTVAVLTVSSLLLWIVNYPHFSMSNYRLYHSRDNIRQYPVTALVVPVILGMGIWASFTNPGTVAPMFVKLFLIWSPYHFSGQTVGITLIYARRNGVSVARWERMALSGFVYGTFAFSTLRAEANPQGYAFLSIHTPGLGVPPWLVDLSEWGMWAAGAGFLVFVVDWSIRNRRVVPLMIVLPAITQYIWLVVGAYTPAYKQLVPMFHSLQYMLIAWGMQLEEKRALKNIAPSRRYVGVETVRWYALNVLGGALLFWVLPNLAASAGYSFTFAAAIMISAVQIHHFFVDGVIWKLRRASNSQPLMMNVRDLLGPAKGSPV